MDGPGGKVQPEHLQHQVQEAMDTMKSNMQEMALREAQLNIIGEKSDILQGTSNQFYQSSRRVRFSETIKEYYNFGIVAITVLEVFVVLFYRAYFFKVTAVVVLASACAIFAIKRYEQSLINGTYQEYHNGDGNV